MLWATGFLVSAAWLPWLPTSGHELRWTLLCVLVPLALLCTSGRAVPLGWPAALGMNFLTWALVTCWWSPHPLPALGAAFHLAILGLTFWLGSTASNPDALYRGMMWGLLPSAALLPLQMAGLTLVPQWNVPSGLFLNRLFLAELALPLLIIAMANQWRELAAIAGVALLLTGSKACLAIAICLGIAHWTKPRWAILAAIPLLAAAAFYSPHTALHRLDIWSWTLSNLTLLGHGLASYPVVFGAEHAHNDALEVAYEAGTIGLALLLFGVAALPRHGVEYVALLSLALVSLVSFPLHNPATAFLAAFLAGRCVAVGAGICGHHIAGRVGLCPGAHGTR